MKKLTGNQKIIVTVIGALLLIFGFFMINKNEGEKSQLLAQSLNTDIPFNEGNTVFDDKVDAYEQEIKDESKKENQSKMSDFGSVNIEGVGTKKLTPEEKVDSLLNANKITYDDSEKNNKGKKITTGNPTTYNNSPSNNTNTKSNDSWSKESEKDNLNGFFSSNPTDNKTSGGKYDDMIYATIYGDKNTADGERVSLRLSKDAIINGVKYPRNTILYSFARFGENRVYLNISKINHNTVNLDVYDTQDGSIGIYTETNFVAETASDASDDVKIKGIPVEAIGKKIVNSAKKNQKVMLFNNYKIILKKGK